MMKECSNKELEEFVYNSGAMYGFLARLYREEVDQKLLDIMCEMEFQADSEISEIADGYKMLQGFLSSMEPAVETDLAVDYTRIFLGVGSKADEGAFPYESVYTSRRGLLMQEARDEVIELYQDEGLVKDNHFNEPEDHIAFELVFMEYLCQKTADSLRIGNDDDAVSYLKKQQEFLNTHLMRWVPWFCKDVQRIALTDFYKALAQITRGYLGMEQELLDEVIKGMNHKN